MPSSNLIKADFRGLQHVSNRISITDRLLANVPKQLIPYRKQDKWGFCTADKTIVIDCIYEAATPFINQLSEVKMNNKWGFIDPNGEIVIPCIYEEVRPFWDDEHNLSVVSLNQKRGVIDKTGKNVIPIEYDFINSMSEGLFLVEQRGSFQYIDEKGNLLFDGDFIEAHSFNEGFAHVGYKDGKSAFIDRDGKVALFLNRRKTGTYIEDGMLPFLNTTNINFKVRWGYYNVKENTTLDPIFDEVSSFNEGLSAVRIKNKWGFIDRNGLMTITPKYDHADCFREGRAVVRLYDKEGVINVNDEPIIDIKYDEVGGFVDGYCCGELNEKSTIIDKAGVEMLPFEFCFLFSTSSGTGLFAVHNKSFLGYMNLEGLQYWED